MHRNRDQKKTQTLQQIQRKHYKVEVNNIQFLKINMSKYESSRNTQPFHVNSFMLAKAYWQLNFFKKINMTTCFVPVEIIGGPPGPTRPDSGHHPRSHSLGFGRWRWGPRLGGVHGNWYIYPHLDLSLDLSDGVVHPILVVHIDSLGVIYCICKYVRHLVSQAGKTTVNRFFWGVLVLLRQVYYGFTMYCHA